MLGERERLLAVLRPIGGRPELLERFQREERVDPVVLREKDVERRPGLRASTAAPWFGGSRRRLGRRVSWWKSERVRTGLTR